jgi:hypothetical protein
MPDPKGNPLFIGGFDCLPAHRIAANERIAEMQFKSIDERLDRIEEAMERLERRLWLTVFGVAGAILAEAFQSISTI